MTHYAVTDPSGDLLINSYDGIKPEALEAVVTNAHARFRAWRSTGEVAERAALLQLVSDLHRQRRQELADLLVVEMGKPIDQALGEVDYCAEIFAYYAGHAERLLADEPITLLSSDDRALLRRSPVGVLIGIMPWNYPYYQASRFAAPNLALGNPVLIKPASQCPSSALAMQAIFDEAGFPGGAYSTVFASNEQIESLIGDRRIQGVSLTGSERAGSIVAETAGRHLKKVVLELGGSDPFIVLSTDDLDAVVRSAVGARIENAGQACTAAKRFLVVDELHDDFVRRFTAAFEAIRTGDPRETDTEVGPLSSRSAADGIADQIDRAVAQGATLLTGGTRTGNVIAPAVLVDVAPDNEIFAEEIFGPVAVIHRVADEVEAVNLANATDFGLGAYVYTTDPDQALRVAEALEAGMVWINLAGRGAPELPFGGIKRSGFGRELGALGLDEFANKKMVRIKS